MKNINRECFKRYYVRDNLNLVIGLVIGKWVDPITKKSFNTTKVIIHYSKNGAHIVPARP
ncbi:polymorphic toxin type 50 domain-containing protein [Paenisporosarcina sp. FSL H8-0542]|uniref:polymorphic toxin type 50 domain-containing protein n=1 Tax=Paenisporosarcina sp. FSL H8-0542 TaxID=2921401 RepID=UPI003159C998